MSPLFFDPQNTPIESIAGEAAVPLEHLELEWLRSKFKGLPEWVPENIAEQKSGGVTMKPISASVLLPIVLRENGLTLLMTKRAAHLTEHGGQISFPGGRAELSDFTEVETALRETEEEIGLHRRHIEVLGVLPNYLTRTGYLVSPVVSIVQPPFELEINPSEVDEIFEIPLSFLMNGLNHQLRSIGRSSDTGLSTFYAIPYGRFFIWGATAAMLRNLFHFLRT